MKKSVIGITLLSAVTITSLSYGDTYQRRAKHDDRRGDMYQQRVRHDDRGGDMYQRRARLDDRRRDTYRQRAMHYDRWKRESPFFMQFSWGSTPFVEQRQTVYYRPSPYKERFIRHRHFRKWGPPFGRPFEQDRYAPPSWRHRHAPRPWWGW